MEIIRSKLLGGFAEGPVEVVVQPDEFGVVSQVLRALCAKEDIVDPKVIDNTFANHKSDDALRFRATGAAFFRLTGMAGILQRGAQTTNRGLQVTTRVMTPSQFKQHQKRYPSAIVYGSSSKHSP